MGTAQQKYDKAGTFRFSQDAKQPAVGLVYFTNYDFAGRPGRSGPGHGHLCEPRSRRGPAGAASLTDLGLIDGYGSRNTIRPPLTTSRTPMPSSSARGAENGSTDHATRSAGTSIAIRPPDRWPAGSNRIAFIR